MKPKVAHRFILFAKKKNKVGTDIGGGVSAQFAGSIDLREFVRRMSSVVL